MTPDDTDNPSRDSLGWLARRTLVVVVIVGLVWLAWRMVRAFLLAFIGILLATLYRGLAGLVSRYTRIPTEWALLVVALVLIGLLVLFVWFAGPPINDQFSQLAKTLPDTIEQIKKAMERSVVGRYLLDYLYQAATTPSQNISLFSGVAGLAMTVYDLVGSILLIAISAIYFSVDPGIYRRGILLLIPKSQSPRLAEILDRTARTLRYWLLGQLILMIFVGTMVTAGLWLIGVPLALVLGIIAGVLEFIPIVGPLVAAVPGILIATTGGWVMALGALFIYFIVQETEADILVPLVQRRTVDVPPALVMIALMAFGLIFGLLGFLVATPLTAIAIVWIKMLYVEDTLGKHADP